MILASSSLSRPGLTSTSTPRALKIATAAGESLSEMRTRGAMGKFLCLETVCPTCGRTCARSAGWGSSRRPRTTCECVKPAMTGSDALSPRAPSPATREKGLYAALASLAFSCAKAQSSQCVSASMSDVSTVAPHQMRRPGGASR